MSDRPPGWVIPADVRCGTCVNWAVSPITSDAVFGWGYCWASDEQAKAAGLEHGGGDWTDASVGTHHDFFCKAWRKE